MVIMRVAIIFDAMISGFVSSLAPLAIIIVLKTLIDLGFNSLVPILKDIVLFSEGGQTTIDT
jgi:hypothetical protein